MKAHIAAFGLSGILAVSGWAMAQEAKQAAPAGEPKAAAGEPKAKGKGKAAPATKPVAPPPTYSGLNPKTMPPTAGTPDNTPPAGFTAAFNGKDLTGWKGLLDPKKKLDNPINRAKLSPEELKAAQAEADENMRAHWTPTDGVLVFEPGEKKTGRSLCTDKLYGDFEMWVDWKIKEGGDSGIYARGTPQIQIWDTNLKNGAHVGSGGLFNNQKNPAIPLKKADKPVGEWNTFFIRMVGDKVTVYLNGELVVDNVVLENYWARQLKMEDQPVFAREQIELQNHGNTLYFKNVYLRELPAGAATPAGADANK